MTFCQGDPVEFTMLDPPTCKVLVKDGNNFKEPTEGTLLGTEVNKPITTGTHYPCERHLRSGELKLIGGLVYEVGGKRLEGDGVKGIQVFLPGWTKPYDYWSD